MHAELKEEKYHVLHLQCDNGSASGAIYINLPPMSFFRPHDTLL
jgi:hypothetical protein